MTIILNENQVSGAKLLPTNSISEVAHLRLNYEQFDKITTCDDKTFNIVIPSGTKGFPFPIILKRCVKCAWSHINKDGITYMQINYRESNILSASEYRDIQLDTVLEL